MGGTASQERIKSLINRGFMRPEMWRTGGDIAWGKYGPDPLLGMPAATRSLVTVTTYTKVLPIPSSNCSVRTLLMGWQRQERRN